MFDGELPGTSIARRLRSGDQFSVLTLVVFRHSFRGETVFEAGTDLSSVQTVQTMHRSNCLLLVIDDEARDAVLNDFRHRPATIGDHRRSARHRLAHDQAERLRPTGGAY